MSEEVVSVEDKKGAEWASAARPLPYSDFANGQPPRTVIPMQMAFPPPRFDVDQVPKYLEPINMNRVVASIDNSGSNPFMNRKLVYDSGIPLATSTNVQVDIVEKSDSREALRRPPSEPTLNSANLKSNGRPTYVEAENLKPYYIVTNAMDETLVFESRFESGNLQRAYAVLTPTIQKTISNSSEEDLRGPEISEYDLIVRPDINTQSVTQWYYFSVRNTRAGKSVRFNIRNMKKPNSLYEEGMRPLVLSETTRESDGCGWIRGCHNIRYYHEASGIQRDIIDPSICNDYVVSFTYTFLHSNDTVYFSYCYPYTFSDLQKDLFTIMDTRERAAFVRRKTLCNTIAGNPVECLTITDYTADAAVIRSRKGVVISARVHPGETNASWMMRGVLELLTCPSNEDADRLRRMFVFRIVPMINPDGVILGNYRCSSSGVDLNRQWARKNGSLKRLAPEVYSIKQMINQFCAKRTVVLYCDLHGHSRKKNVFMYGCENDPSDGSVFQKERVFPKLFARRAGKDGFSFSDCSFAVSKAKETTARVVVRREFDIIDSFTLEASFLGPDHGPYQFTHFNTRHMQNMGRELVLTLLDYSTPEVYRETLVDIRVQFHSTSSLNRQAESLSRLDASRRSAEDISEDLEEGMRASRERERRIRARRLNEERGGKPPVREELDRVDAVVKRLLKRSEQKYLRPSDPRSSEALVGNVGGRSSMRNIRASSNRLGLPGKSRETRPMRQRENFARASSLPSQMREMSLSADSSAVARTSASNMSWSTVGTRHDRPSNSQSRINRIPPSRSFSSMSGRSRSDNMMSGSEDDTGTERAYGSRSSLKLPSILGT